MNKTARDTVIVEPLELLHVAGSAEGHRNAFRHGRTAVAIASRRELAALIRQMRVLANTEEV